MHLNIKYNQGEKRQNFVFLAISFIRYIKFFDWLKAGKTNEGKVCDLLSHFHLLVERN